MKHLKKILKDLWRDESGQGATEYILILVVVSVIILIFKTEIAKIIKAKTIAVGGRLDAAITAIK